jgi:hypothetical protein
VIGSVEFDVYDGLPAVRGIVVEPSLNDAPALFTIVSRLPNLLETRIDECFDVVPVPDVTINGDRASRTIALIYLACH